MSDNKVVFSNPKAIGWDEIGGLFWKAGRKNARPDKALIDLFLSGIERNEPCLIVGASTKGLISDAIGRGISLTVVDFSEKMCADLNKALSQKCEIIHHDILKPPLKSVLSNKKYIISDRLINRFSKKEINLFFQNIYKYLAPDGEIRTTVKLGLYEIDKILIRAGKRKGTLQNFYNESEKWIDFSMAKNELLESNISHGSIPKDTLIDWYLSRGKEARFNQQDIPALISRFGYRLFEEKQVDSHTKNYYYKFKRAI